MQCGMVTKDVAVGLVVALIITGLSVLMAFLKARKDTLAGPVLYGLTTGAALAVLWFAFTGNAIFAKSSVTPDNIEEYVKVWVDNLAMGIAKKEDSTDTIFDYVITPRSGHPQEVARFKDRPAYLEFAVQINFSPDDQAIMNKLSKEQAERVINKLSLELARYSKVGFEIRAAKDRGTSILLIHGVPIVSMSEGYFLACINDMDSAQTVLRSATALVLADASADAPKIKQLAK